MVRLLIAASLALVMATSSQASESETVAMAKEAAVAWLALTDTGQYGASWDSASPLFRAAISREDWEKSLGAVRTPLGANKSRDAGSGRYSTTLPGAPDGEYVVIQFDSSFENKASAVETVTTMKDADGAWKVAGYFIK